MNKKQTQQFNRMRAALIRIYKEYDNPEKIIKSETDFGFPGVDALKMAYENIQLDAKVSVKGVRVMKAYNNE